MIASHSSACVSVVIPCYNGAAYLSEAIESVLAQDYHPIDLIVVDDGSTDDSAAVAQQYQAVRVIRKAHSGLGATLNVGIRESSGELLAFLDADDRWLPNRLAVQVPVLEHNPMVDLVFGYVRQFAASESGEVLLSPQPGVSKCSLLIRRSAFVAAGYFPEDPMLHDFVDWYARALDAGLHACVIRDVVAERRVHCDNIGRRDPEAQRHSYLTTLREITTRRRSGVVSAPRQLSGSVQAASAIDSDEDQPS